MFSSKENYLLSEGDLQEYINQLISLYMPTNLDDSYHQNKVTAIKRIHFIIKHSSRFALQKLQFEQLLVCALTLVYYFGMRIKLKMLRSWYLWGISRWRHFQKAEAALKLTMNMLLPECSATSIKVTLNFFTEVSLWSFESFVEQILELLLYFDRGKMTLFNMMLTDIYYVLHEKTPTRHRMRVFYNLLLSPYWIIDENKLLPFVTRLLDFFAYIGSQDDSTSARYVSKGFEVCLSRIFERVENRHRMLIISRMLNWFSMINLDKEHVLEFSTLLDHAAELYEVQLYSASLEEGLIEHVLVNLVGSTIALNSLVGCRLLLKFLDRQRNAQYLLVPRLFYEYSQLQLKIGEYNDKDMHFIRNHREKLNLYLMNAIKMHGSIIVNLNTIYTIVCCVVLEVPCGLTAAAAAFLVMSIQDQALNGANITAPRRYWMHAFVVSVMSLICCVHKAPVLYTYVQHIVSRRAMEAPQLNPPMMFYYKIARHHITWNKPTLFFEDWELRYALWKHFKEPQAKSSEAKLANKVPLLDLRN